MAIVIDRLAVIFAQLRGKLEDKFAANIVGGSPTSLEYLQELMDQVFEQFKPDDLPMQPSTEIVRVMRVYVFEGERKSVDEQLARSLGDGTRYVNGRPGDDIRTRGIKIHVATIGTIPQILPLNAGYPSWNADAPMAEPLGAHMVYVCRPSWPGNIEAEYDRALACGATAIVIPTDGGTASNLYSIEQFRKQWGHSFKQGGQVTIPASPPPAPQEAPPIAPQVPPIEEITQTDIDGDGSDR